MKKDYFIQLEVLPSFTFKIWKRDISKNKWHVFNFTSIYSLTVEDKNNEEKVKKYENFFALHDELIACISFIHMYNSQALVVLEDRLKKKTRNLKVINQYHLSYNLKAGMTANYYHDLIKITQLEKKEYLNEEKNKYSKSYIRKEFVKEVLVKMKKTLEDCTTELKNELNLPEFMSHNESDENVALVGLVSRNNKVMLAITSQDSENDNRSVLLEPKKFIALVKSVDKAVIIQQHKELEKTKYQQAKPQIIAYFIPKDGVLKVVQGVAGDVLTNKDDIVKQDLFKIDIDLLLTYYRVLNFELKNKERFEELLYGAETYNREFKINIEDV